MSLGKSQGWENAILGSGVMFEFLTLVYLTIGRQTKTFQRKKISFLVFAAPGHSRLEVQSIASRGFLSESQKVCPKGSIHMF